jgi:hypothetical protein
MRVKTVEGGWYCDALPSGAYAVIFHDDAMIETRLGYITAGERIIYPRITEIGGFKVAGQTHADPPRILEYANGIWTPIGKGVPEGMNPVIYDNQGILHIDTVGSGIGASGYRYVSPNGTLIQGDETYGPKDRIELHEWTDLGTVRIGQGPDNNGAWLYDKETSLYYEVIPGDARCIRAYRVGDSITIACWVRPRQSVMVWATIAQIKAERTAKNSPKLVVSVPVPTPNPTPTPTPTPEEPKMTMEMPIEVYETYSACVDKFPHAGSDDDRRAAHRKAVETVKARHGSRWATKTEHNTGWVAASTDALVYIPNGPVVHGQKTQMFIWDMINGETREVVGIHTSEPLRSAYALVPEAKDWLAEEGQETPTPPTTPTPPSTPPSVPSAPEELVNALKTIEELGRQVSMLSAQLISVKAELMTVRTLLESGFEGHNRWFGTIDIKSKGALK